MNAVAELAAIIERKGLSLDAAAAEVGVPPEELFKWLLYEGEPAPFFLQLLPGVLADLDLLYVDSAERKA